MDDESAFLHAIYEHPDEDTPRLVFADWLQERGETGDEARAELIRAQVASARRPTGPVPVSHPPARDPLGGRGVACQRFGFSPLDVLGWDRGLPLGLRLPFETLRAAWPRCVDRVPLRQLSVSVWADENVAELVTWSGLALLRELTVDADDHPPLSERAVLALAGCADLRDLQSLTLAGFPLTEETALALLASPSLASLEKLRLRYPHQSASFSPAVEDWLFSRFGPDVIG